MNRERVLVVDDDPGILHAVKRILARQYDVTTANGPEQALEAAPGLRPDLALVDVRMPGMSGFELLERFKQIVPGIDVIVMTGSVRELDALLVRAIRAQAYYFIQKPFDRIVLQTLVDRCFEVRRLEQENRRHTLRLEREMTVARKFQRGLLPPPHARFGRVSVWARYEPCAELGGDFYDYIACDDGGVDLVLADVSGHGVSAAMLTALVKSAFHECHEAGGTPRDVIERIATSMRSFSPSRFITVLCLRIDGAARRLTYVNAGHPAGIVWGDGHDAILLEPSGTPICSAFDERDWTSQQVELAARDRLLLYTDGFLELDGETGQFGFRRMSELTERFDAGGEALLEGAWQTVESYTHGRPVDDDLTMVTARVD